MVARVTALWASLVGKRGGKATNHCINATGRLSLLLQIGRKADMHVPTRDHTDSPVQAPKVHQILISTGDESSGYGLDSTGGLRPRHLRERNPEKSLATYMETGLS